MSDIFEGFGFFFVLREAAIADRVWAIKGKGRGRIICPPRLLVTWEGFHGIGAVVSSLVR